MYLNIGKGNVIETGDIIGIFDLDITSQSHITRKFLNLAEKNGCIINASEDIPKSYIVCCKKNGERKIYLSQMAPATLIKRSESGLI